MLWKKIAKFQGKLQATASGVRFFVIQIINSVSSFYLVDKLIYSFRYGKLLSFTWIILSKHCFLIVFYGFSLMRISTWFASLLTKNVTSLLVKCQVIQSQIKPRNLITIFFVRDDRYSRSLIYTFFYFFKLKTKIKQNLSLDVINSFTKRQTSQTCDY